MSLLDLGEDAAQSVEVHARPRAAPVLHGPEVSQHDDANAFPNNRQKTER